jgi:single-strand DNA-binding protein
MYQKVLIVGNLGADPELRYTPSGQAVTNLNIATNRRWTNSEGQQQEETTWFRVTVWGKQAESCNQYLSKGRQVLCEGRLRPDINIWTDQNGNPRASYEMTAYEVKFMSGGRSDGNEYNNNNNSMAEPAGMDAGMSEDEIPF